MIRIHAFHEFILELNIEAIDSWTEAAIYNSRTHTSISILFEWLKTQFLFSCREF